LQGEQISAVFEGAGSEAIESECSCHHCSMLLSALLARPGSALRDQGGEAQTPPLERAKCADLVRDHHDFIWRLLARMGLSGADVDDACQQVFLVTFTRPTGSIRAGSERSFLFGVALRVCQEFRRKERRDRLHDADAAERLFSKASPEEALERQRSWALLQSVLERMSDDVRAAFVLYELEGMTVPEIAEVTGVPLGTVASRLRRGRDLFQAAVAQLAPKGGAA
jgi:RNA polymerase sigma-70 factor (ECF subfamily)